eukprot:TRINITY_DN14905_c0_g1_i1.p1 TRINITY_DN14905_c0_g1~~TRINITY_DN14905_c0_g1_i1.p1  ORF type:complete len:165 (-),score=33.40 TRINITY_DN14905_c0_g1_i1:85-519(-)
MTAMRTSIVLLLVAVALVFVVADAKMSKPDKLQIGVLKRPETCERRATNGDTLKIHYSGKVWGSDEEFDSSYSRGDPFTFALGRGSVIKGWDQGLIGMCIGEKRKLTIPPALGYGDAGAGAKIPGGATLVFTTELIDIVSSADR